MKFDILTIFPDVVETYVNESILGRAQKKKLIKIKAHNFRDYSKDKHKRVDDTPYGGGAGMVFTIQPIYDCLKKIKAVKKTKNQKIVILDPAGKKFDQKMAKRFSKLDRLVLIAGRYEGFDARIYDLVDERVSVGDYVLAGGELPALTITEATARLVPGVLGNIESLKSETHNIEGEKDFSVYTKPEKFMKMKVPKVLLSGNHAEIEKWRKKHSK